MIIVLPFANLGSYHEQDYFAEAITDALTTRISPASRAASLIAHSYRAARSGESPWTCRQIGQDMDVQYVLEGSVRWMGEQVQVNSRS